MSMSMGMGMRMPWSACRVCNGVSEMGVVGVVF